MRIGISGLGCVGAFTASCLAERGHLIFGVQNRYEGPRW